MSPYADYGQSSFPRNSPMNHFKAVEFDRFMYEAGSNSFVLSPGK
jgi:hypothetical protein